MKYKKWLMCLVLSCMLTGCGQTMAPVTSLANTSLPPRIKTFSPTDCTNVTEIPLSECTVLIALYTQTSGTAWRTYSGWTRPTPCSRPWFGITCAGGHVTKIELSNNHLSGSIPSLSGLTSLGDLILDNNNLSGSIPSLSGLARLQFLSLNNNQLSGPVPANIIGTNAYHLHLCGGSNSLTSPDAPTDAWIAARDKSWTAGVGCTATTFTPTITLTPTPS